MKENRLRMTDSLALLVFAVFALCIWMVLLAGAGVYQELVRSGEENYARHTALRYLTMRVHQAQTVEIGDFGGCETLFLEETLGEETYITRVYCYDGQLRELYAESGARLVPADGEPVLKAERLSVSLEGNLLTIGINGDELALYLPAERQVVP